MARSKKTIIQINERTDVLLKEALCVLRKDMSLREASDYVDKIIYPEKKTLLEREDIKAYIEYRLEMEEINLQDWEIYNDVIRALRGVARNRKGDKVARGFIRQFILYFGFRRSMAYADRRGMEAEALDFTQEDGLSSDPSEISH